MENKMEIFKNEEFGSVRVIKDGDKYLFCGSDVAKALGYANSRKALIDHCKGVTKRDTLTSGGTQSLSYIPEGDVYRLIVHSKLPSAERFEKWVFDEVLPCIRRYGVYITDEKVKLFAEHPELLDAVLRTLIVKTAESQQLQKEKTELLPKVEYFDAFIETDACTNIRATAKELQVSERWFARFLQKTGFLYRCPAGNLMPYAIPRNKGLFRVKDYVRNGYSGAYTLITPAGKTLFRQLIRDDGGGIS